jgi:hypothetical protein
MSVKSSRTSKLRVKIVSATLVSVKKKGSLKRFKRTTGNAERLAATTSQENTQKEGEKRSETLWRSQGGAPGILLLSGGEAPSKQTPVTVSASGR